MAASTVPGHKTGTRVLKQWFRICAGIVAMMAVTTPLYASALASKSLTTRSRITLAAVQIAFAAFILVEKWLVSIETCLLDRLGPGTTMTLRNKCRIGSEGGKWHD